MRAVTIISPGFERTGGEAVRRVREHAGIEVDVLQCEAHAAHRVKLQAFADAARRGWRWWFDADWWLLHPCEEEFRQTLGPWVAGAPIPVDKARTEGREYGYDPRCRATTGFVAFDPTLPRWDRAMKLALDLQSARGAGRDELFFNAALQHFQIPVRMLDSGWNWCFQATTLYGYTPPVIHAVHAAGVPMQDKEALLRKAAEAHAARPDSWGLDEKELAWLGHFARTLLEAGLRDAVAFGSGRNTHQLLEAGCAVTACETDARACCIATTDLPETCRVKLIPHEPGLGGLDVPCDWAFVDGPPGHLLLDSKARWHVLDWCRSRCRLIVLHDSRRPGEQASIAALQELGWAAHHVDTPRGLCVLTSGPAITELATRGVSRSIETVGKSFSGQVPIGDNTRMHTP